MKNKPLFHITYETVTEESASIGDVASRGFLPEGGDVPEGDYFPQSPYLFTLREALEMIRPGGSAPIEADSCPCDVPRWLTCQISEDWERPNISLSLHFERSGISDASARRIARLFGVKLKSR